MTDKTDRIELDLDADTTGLKKSKAVVNQFVDDTVDGFNRADAASQKASKAMVKSSRNVSNSFRGVGRNAGQASIQFQQFFGQLQGGVQPMVAVSQQAADLGIVLGAPLLGSVVGISAALAGMFLPSLINSGEQVDELKEKLKGLKKEQVLGADQLAYLASLEELETEEKKKKIKTLVDEIKKNEELNQVRSSAGTAGNTSQFAVPLSAEANQKKYAEAIKATNQEIAFQKAQIQTLRQEVGQETVTLIAEEERKKAEAKRLAAVEQAFKNEQELMTAHQQNLTNIEQGFYSETVAREIERDIAAQQRENARFSAQVEALGSDHTLIEEAKRLHEDKLTQISQEHSKRRMAIDQAEKAAKLSALSSTFGALSSLMNTESKKLFEIGKASALAGAIVDGFAAVAKTMSSVPYPFNIPLAAAQAAASAVQVQNIAKQKIGGGTAANSGSFSGGAPVTNTQSQQGPSQNISISGLNPNDLYTGTQVKSLFDAIQGGLNDGHTLTFT